uniref:Protein kinase domain-containing protein n=1 Tax=Kalanchoe fedtschenkoi TaxID=63787 RepID=A0A7N0UZB0_KALFE
MTSLNRLSFPILLLLCLISFAAAAATDPDQLQLLQTIKASLQSDANSEALATWDDKTPVCSFAGVRCDGEGLVNEIDLTGKRLAGALPVDSICRLPSLEKLALGFNSLRGEVGAGLNSCVGLTYLDLGNNLFSGSVPDISGLTRLQHLYLNKSGFSGRFPWRALTNMTELRTLSVGDNAFETSPFPPEALKLTKLKDIYMSNCSISGPIPPQIGELTELETLELSDNGMTGPIPAEIGKLRSLWMLEIYNNKLNGTIPDTFRNLTNLQKLDLSTNYIHGDLSALRNLTNLVTIQLFENELTGEIPPEFGEFKKLVNLSLYTNSLTGQLPASLGSWAEFLFIDVSTNHLTGPIPKDMCKNGKMFALLMLENNFTGEIPESYARCASLKRFRVGRNQLTGAVPAGLWGLPELNIVDIERNLLEGSIGSEIGSAKSLTTVWAGNNKLCGELPEEIVKATSLDEIDLQSNRISGNIPAAIGDLKLLSSLNLQGNEIGGEIPDSIGECMLLSSLNLSRNILTGKIPATIGELPALNSLDLSNNEISGEIPESLAALHFSFLDLSNNRLSGRVPSFLSSKVYSGSLAGNEGLCGGGGKLFPPCAAEKRRSVRTLVICLVTGSVVVGVLVAILVCLKKAKVGEVRSLSWSMKSFQLVSFTEDEIIEAIKPENLIGKGGSGSVYRVTLSGRDLAVKHIWNPENPLSAVTTATSPILGGGRRRRSEFESEVATLSAIRHVNVVKLYCSITSDDSSSSLLVYEYMPRGSLWDRLHLSEKLELDWETRYEIALGSARGLEYLHHGLTRPVVHRDVKSSNILLDDFFKPRIADFGLAKIANSGGASKDSHVVAGTHGYIAPEYGYTYRVDEKSDVYSFGVVLMELVTGKRPMEPEFGDNKDIVGWVCGNMKNKESVMGLVDSRLPEALKEEAVKVLRIAVICTARLPSIRPTMRSVVQMLEEAEPCKVVTIVASKKEMEGDEGKFKSKISSNF